MAFYDWNNNGKKDIQDDFIEYNIYKRSTENNKGNRYNESGGISNFGAGCGTFLTIIIAAAIAGAFGLEGIPLVIVFIILASVIGACIAWYFDKIGF